MTSAIVEYASGLPTHRGVYACRLPDDNFKEKFLDKFLFFDGRVWSYLGSDMMYRGQVPYWIGPLRRRMEDAQ